MLIRILLTYWGRRVCILNILFLRKISYKSNTNRIERVFFMNIQKILKAFISSLHNKSSSAIEYTIHHSYKIITSSNDANISEMSSFSSESNITTGSASINVSNDSLIFGIDGNYQQSITSNDTCLNIAIANIII